jgi:hypothetical protein
MNLLISVDIPLFGRVYATTENLDKAIQFFSLADNIQLQAILCGMTEEGDFHRIDSRIVLLVILCDFCTITKEEITSLTIPRKYTAKAIVNSRRKGLS